MTNKHSLKPNALLLSRRSLVNQERSALLYTVKWRYESIGLNRSITTAAVLRSRKSRINRWASVVVADGGRWPILDAAGQTTAVTCVPLPTQWSGAMTGHLSSPYNASHRPRRPRETPPTTTPLPTDVRPSRPCRRWSPADSGRVPGASKDDQDSVARENRAVRKCPAVKYFN